MFHYSLVIFPILYLSQFIVKGEIANFCVKVFAFTFAFSFSNMAEAPRENTRRSLESDLDAEEPTAKKAKAKRQWKAGTLPDTKTPIRAGTNEKTPMRPKEDKKAMREAMQEVVDIQMETVTEKVKELQISMNELKEKMYDLNEDQWAFRKQQLWALKN